MNERSRDVPGAMLLHPIALTALAAWAVNDHVLKGWAWGALTGKLSDVASLVFFPLLAAAAVEIGSPTSSLRRRRIVLVASVAVTAAVMATINTLDLAAFGYRWGLGTAQWPLHALRALAHGVEIPPLRPVRLTMDPTDLWTLPAATIALIVGWPRAAGAP